MEDLIIFGIIIVIGVVRFVLAVTKNKPSSSSSSSDEKPNTLEAFFQSLTEQKPTKVAEWPEGRDRPDYIHEMETFDEHTFQEEIQEQKTPEPTFFPDPTPVPPPAPPSIKQTKPSPFAPPKEIEDAIANTDISIRKAHPRFQIKTKAQLRKAVLGHIVFGPPKALNPDQQI